MADADSYGEVAKTGKTKRRWQRRWASICKGCGCPIIFLDNPTPAPFGQKWSPWVMVEIYGTVNGEPAPWRGEIAFDPQRHARHVCVSQRARIAWIIRQANDDI